MRALGALVIALFLLPGTISALPTAATPAAGPLGLPTEVLFDNATAIIEERTGQNLTREDVRIRLDLEFRTLDFDLVGVIFGGGTFEANARLELKAEFRAISVARINDLLSQQSGGIVDIENAGVNASRQVLAADEFRAALGGEALAAFESEQERALMDLIESTLPDLTVLAARFAWANVTPAESTRGDDPLSLTEPPIALTAKVDLQYLKRESLISIIETVRAKRDRDEAAGIPDDEELDPQKVLLERLRSENQGAFYERSAFSVLGMTQLLALRMDPGWDLEVMMTLPKGYTFEYGSADVTIDPTLASARTFTLAGDADRPVENPVAVSLSNRYLVTVSLLAATLLLGAILRVPVLLASSSIVSRRALKHRRGRPIVDEDMASG